MKSKVGSLALLVALRMTLLAVAPTQAATKISSCPVIISAPGVYQLTQDVTCSGTAITILSNNVDLHLGGHTLTGDGSGMGIYVQGQSDVSIHHGTVQNFQEGIFLVGTLNSSVSHLTVRQNPDLGINVQDGAAGISVTDNTLYQNGQAIQIAFSSHACTVARNTTYQNARGIVLTDGAFANTVVNNTATQNGDGINVRFGATLNTVQRNTTNSNSGVGIYLFGSATNNNVTDNTANLNNLGIWLEAGDTGNSIQGNTALNNTGGDLGDQNSNCDSNAWSNNTFVTDNVAGAGDGGPDMGCIR
jgi:parallel beta-helix repeat protein